MDNIQKISLPTNLLAAVAARIPQPGRISPFWPYHSEKVAQPLPAGVAGITDANGEMTEQAGRIFSRLAEVKTFVRILVSDRHSIAEKLVYFSADGTSTLLVLGQKTFEMTTPAPVADIIAGLAEHLGISTAALGDFSAELSSDEALALAVVIDLERRQVLTELAAGREPSPVAVDATGIEKQLSAATDGAQWLTSLVANLGGQNGTPAVDKILAALHKNGFIVAHGSGYLPADVIWEIAGNLPLTDRLCTVSAGREANGAVVVTGFTCVIGGVANMLYIEAADGRMRIKTPAAREVLAEIEYLLTTPDALQPLADALPAEPPPDGEEAVAQTAASAEEEEPVVAAFCRQCGKPVQAWAKYCTACGTLIKN